MKNNVERSVLESRKKKQIRKLFQIISSRSQLHKTYYSTYVSTIVRREETVARVDEDDNVAIGNGREDARP